MAPWHQRGCSEGEGVEWRGCGELGWLVAPFYSGEAKLGFQAYPFLVACQWLAWVVGRGSLGTVRGREGGCGSAMPYLTRSSKDLKIGHISPLSFFQSQETREWHGEWWYYSAPNQAVMEGVVWLCHTLASKIFQRFALGHMFLSPPSSKNKMPKEKWCYSTMGWISTRREG